MSKTNWTKITSNKSFWEYYDKNSRNVLRVVFNKGSSYVLLIGGKQRRFLYQVHPGKRKKVSQNTSTKTTHYSRESSIKI